jgi:predicted dehydrogenase
METKNHITPGRRLKVGIAGFGKMGMLHGALAKQLKDVELTAITDTSRIILHAFRKFLPNTRFYTSHKKMLEECALDALIIATPVFSHAPIALDAIEKNIDVFIEKPLTNTFESAHKLLDAVNGKKIISMVGFCLREAPSFQEAKEAISSGVVGRVECIKAQMYAADVLSEQKGWRYKKEASGGGALMDLGIHILDLLYWYFGKVQNVSAIAKKIYSEEVEDEVEGDIEFKNGARAKIMVSWSNPDFRKAYARIEITGEKGVLTATDQTLQIINRQTGKEEKLTFPDMYKGYHIDIGGALYSTQMAKFITAVKNRVNPGSDIESACNIQNIVDKIYLSARQGKKIAL